MTNGQERQALSEDKQACECEHAKHTDLDGEGHGYITNQPGVLPVRTTWGTLRLCQVCRETCAKEWS